MAKYLVEFRDLITKRQTAQVLNLLNEKRSIGQIRTVDEFNSQLNGLVKDILDTVLQPSLKLFMARGLEPIDSESYNYMLDRLQDDLDAAFEEANNINTVVNSHEAIIRDIVMKRLREALSDLERRLATYKFFDEDNGGLTQALYSTFKEGSVRVGRGAKEVLLFTDPRTNTLLKVNDDAVIDVGAERLVLSEEEVVTYTITRAEQIFDSEAQQSELPVEPAFSSIQNMTDGVKGTYWLQSLLFSQLQDEVKVKVGLSLGGPRDINFVEVEPATRNGVILDTIEYIDSANELKTLSSPSLFISARKKIAVDRVAAKKIILTFKNISPRKVEFEYNTNVVPLFDQAINEPLEGWAPDLKSAEKELYNLIDDKQIKSMLNITDPTENSSVFVGYEYSFGIDNVWVGEVKYNDVGIYAAGKVEVEKLGRLALRATESRPVTSGQSIVDTATTYDLGDTNMVHSSIEYYIFRKDYGEDDVLLRSAIVPIIPKNVSRINHERLLLTEQSVGDAIKDIGFTRFFTNRTSGDVKVFKNGVEINDVTDGGSEGWEDISDSDDRTPNTGDPMTMKIQVTSPSEGDIYTISYDVLTSTTGVLPTTLNEFVTRSGALVADLSGDLSSVMLSDNSVSINKDLLGVDVATSDVYLIIILRRNTSSTTVTAAVEDFVLGAAGSNSEL